MYVFKLRAIRTKSGKDCEQICGSYTAIPVEVFGAIHIA